MSKLVCNVKLNDEAKKLGAGLPKSALVRASSLSYQCSIGPAPNPQNLKSVTNSKLRPQNILNSRYNLRPRKDNNLHFKSTNSQVMIIKDTVDNVLK